MSCSYTASSGGRTFTCLWMGPLCRYTDFISTQPNLIPNGDAMLSRSQIVANCTDAESLQTWFLNRWQLPWGHNFSFKRLSFSSHLTLETMWLVMTFVLRGTSDYFTDMYVSLHAYSSSILTAFSKIQFGTISIFLWLTCFDPTMRNISSETACSSIFSSFRFSGCRLLLLVQYLAQDFRSCYLQASTEMRGYQTVRFPVSSVVLNLAPAFLPIRPAKFSTLPSSSFRSGCFWLSTSLPDRKFSKDPFIRFSASSLLGATRTSS